MRAQVLHCVWCPHEDAHVIPASVPRPAPRPFDHPGLVVIKFYASWCRACKAMAPKIDAIAEEWPGVIDHSHSPIAPRPTPRTHSERAALTALPPPRPLLRGTATRCVRRVRVLPAHVRQQQEAVQEPGDQGAAVPRDHRGQQGQGRVLQLRPLEDLAAAGAPLAHPDVPLRALCLPPVVCRRCSARDRRGMPVGAQAKLEAHGCDLREEIPCTDISALLEES